MVLIRRFTVFGVSLFEVSFGLVSLFLAIIYHKNIHFSSLNVVQSRQVSFVENTDLRSRWTLTD